MGSMVRSVSRRVLAPAEELGDGLGVGAPGCCGFRMLAVKNSMKRRRGPLAGVGDEGGDDEAADGRPGRRHQFGLRSFCSHAFTPPALGPLSYLITPFMRYDPQDVKRYMHACFVGVATLREFGAKASHYLRSTGSGLGLGFTGGRYTGGRLDRVQPEFL